MTTGRDRNAPPAPGGDIPDKIYFKIGEVAELVGVENHVLRYWEKEIASIRPIKSPTNQRRYRRKDVEMFREIRRLLYEERYTLAGARKHLAATRANADGATKAETATEVLATATVIERASARSAEQNGEHSPRVRVRTAVEVQEPATDTVLTKSLSDAAAAEPMPLRLAPPMPSVEANATSSRVAELDHRLDRARTGLRELIRMAGEEP